MEIYDGFVHDVCETHGCRMHRKDKKAFRKYLIEQARAMGYDVREEKSILGTNVVVGNPADASTICTAHYDTPPRLPKFVVKHMILTSFIMLPAILLGISYGLPQLLIGKISVKALQAVLTGISIGEYGLMGGMVAYLFGCLGGANKKNFNDNSSGCVTLLKLMKKYEHAPKDVKSKLCFSFFDNEEKGLLGSMAFRLKHNKHLDNQTFMNFDCVGKGDQFNLYYFGKNKPQIVQEMENTQMSNGYITKPIRSSMMSMSDHLLFKKFNHVCFLSVDQKNNKSLYSQIHSSNDTELDTMNLDVICETVSNSSAFKLAKPEVELNFEKPENLYTLDNAHIINHENASSEEIRNRVLANYLKNDSNDHSDEMVA